MKNLPFNMNYDRQTAQHFEAYRPPLHRLILSEIIGGKHFDSGLDIGCGTGHSAIALAEFCHDVLGIDSSEEMLRHTTNHEKVKYRHCQDLNSLNQSFEIVTMAGSLFYLKSQKMVNEVSDLLEDHGWLIIYDFDIQLNHILKKLAKITQSPSNYDHKINLNGLNHRTLKLTDSGHYELKFELTSGELAHLILSESYLFAFFQEHFAVQNPHDSLRNILDESKIGKPKTLIAGIYYSVYQKEVNGGESNPYEI